MLAVTVTPVPTDHPVDGKRAGVIFGTTLLFSSLLLWSSKSHSLDSPFVVDLGDPIIQPHRGLTGRPSTSTASWLPRSEVAPVAPSPRRRLSARVRSDHLVRHQDAIATSSHRPRGFPARRFVPGAERNARSRLVYHDPRAPLFPPMTNVIDTTTFPFFSYPLIPSRYHGVEQDRSILQYHMVS